MPAAWLPRGRPGLRPIAIALTLLCLGVLSTPSGGLARGPNVAVVYPEIREPYRAIFESIVRGIEQENLGEVNVRVLQADTKPEELDRWLTESRAETVVALGRKGLAAVQHLRAGYRRVVGAVLLKPEPSLQGFWGISLTPAPEQLFKRLNSLAPGVRRVLVVYNPSNNQWLIDRARGSAVNLGLDLKAVPAADLREAATVYRRLLPEMSGPGDAIWLLQDRQTVDERAILPLMLEAAWNGDIVLFSSNPGHVKRGALFSLYPNHQAMGRSLGSLAAATVTTKPHIDPLRDLQTAVNIRTAEHLGIEFSNRDLRDFGLVFPAP